MEEEDKDVRNERLMREQQERETTKRDLDEKDVQWEERKQRDGELRDKKRGRGVADDEEVGGSKTTQGARRKVKIRRLKFETLEEDCGEADDEDDPPEPVLPPPPVILRRGVKHSLTGTHSLSVITDYFSPKPKRIKMDRCDGRSLGCVKFPKSFRNFTASGFSAGV